MALQYIDAALVLHLVLGANTPSSDVAEDVTNLVDLEEAATESSTSVRAALYTVQASSKAHLPVVHALVMHTLTCMAPLALVLDTVCSREGKAAVDEALVSAWHSVASKAHAQTSPPQRYILLVMLCDLFFGKKPGTIAGGGHLRRILLSHKNVLDAALARIKIRARVADPAELVPMSLRNQTPLPRYARVNSLQSTVPQVLEELRVSGFRQVNASLMSEHLRSQPWSNEKIVAIDPDVCDGELLVFSAMVDLHAHPLVLRGALVLQQKASTFSGWLLHAPPDSVALDACAAPGMKTSQIAASMRDTGTLYAVDRSARRLATLRALAERNGMHHTIAVNSSFLDLDPCSAPYNAVEYLLCDPSCSGSGITNRGDDVVAFARRCLTSDLTTPNAITALLQFVPERVSRMRLASLSDFQVRVVLHALSFPRARRVVYSTCSIHWAENEEVVLRALKECGNAWTLAHAMPQWPHRGGIAYMHDKNEEKFLDETEAKLLATDVALEKCVRASKENLTIGFFVAVFERNEFSAHSDGFERSKNVRDSKAMTKRSRISTNGDESPRLTKRPRIPVDGEKESIEWIPEKSTESTIPHPHDDLPQRLPTSFTFSALKDKH